MEINKTVKILICATVLMVMGIVVFNALTTPPLFAPTFQDTSGIIESSATSHETSSRKTSSRKTSSRKTSSKKTSSKKTSSRKTSSRKTSSPKVSSSKSVSSRVPSSSRVTSVETIEMVNINTITYEQLAVIDGIGEELAANIIEFRNNCGQFENMDQLLNVKGMSYDKRRILKAYVYVELVSSK